MSRTHPIATSHFLLEKKELIIYQSRPGPFKLPKTIICNNQAIATKVASLNNLNNKESVMAWIGLILFGFHFFTYALSLMAHKGTTYTYCLVQIEFNLIIYNLFSEKKDILNHIPRIIEHHPLKSTKSSELLFV